MTILWAGGEDSNFAFTGSVAEVTSGTYAFNSTYSRAGIQVQTSTADPPANRFQTQTFTSISAVWVRAFVGNNGAGVGTGNGQQSLRLLSPDGNTRVIIRTDGSSHLKLTTRNAAGTLTDKATSTNTVLSSGTTRYPLDVYVDFTITGGAIVYFNGVEFINYVGDLRTDAATQLNQLELGNVYNTQCWWSEVVVSDEDTRGIRLWTIAPVASGNTQSWTPNTVGNINEAALSDSTIVSSSNNNDLMEWTTSTSVPAGTWQVRGIVQSARAQIAATAGPQHFDWLVRTGSADFTASSPNAPNVGSFSNFNYVWNTNPSALRAWATTDIVAGFNLGVKSLA